MDRRETNFDRLERAIFSIDTEAGHRFRYHRRQEDVASLDGISERLPADILSGAFIWELTPEGHAFWSYIYHTLIEKEA